MGAAGYAAYQPGMIDGATEQVATAVRAGQDGAFGGVAGIASDALRARGAQQAAALAASQGGYLRTAMSDQERIREDERQARAEQARAAAAARTEQVRMQIEAAKERAQEANGLRRDLAGIAASARAGQQTQLKRIPQAAFESMKENDMAIMQIDQALGAVAKTPNALGPSNIGPGEWIKNKVGGATADEQFARAAVADIGSKIIHTRSGAAVTISEYPRLRPFVPSATDTPQEAKVKLARLGALLREEAALYQANFGEDQGYQPFVSMRGAAAPDARNDRAPAATTVPARRQGESIADYRKRTGGR
jgi:hypothetical protein